MAHMENRQILCDMLPVSPKELLKSKNYTLITTECSVSHVEHSVNSSYPYCCLCYYAHSVTCVYIAVYVSNLIEKTMSVLLKIYKA